MMERKPNRMKGYDYSQDALYYVTSCTWDRICFFGIIENHEMKLNQSGQIAFDQWQWLIRQYPYLVSHAFVVMPDHIHAVLEIDSSRVFMDPHTGFHHPIVGTGRDLSLQSDDELPRHSIKIKSLSELMGAYKTTTSKQIHLLESEYPDKYPDKCRDRSRPVPDGRPVPTFQWQRSFHDHIIRDYDSYVRIVSYINSNPANWNDDHNSEFHIFHEPK
jgi:putative transposase